MYKIQVVNYQQANAGARRRSGKHSGGILGGDDLGRDWNRLAQRGSNEKDTHVRRLAFAPGAAQVPGGPATAPSQRAIPG